MLYKPTVAGRCRGALLKSIGGRVEKVLGIVCEKVLFG